MAWYPDDSLTISIGITAEGYADIISHTFPVSAHVGDIITGKVTWKNTGTATDNFRTLVTLQPSTILADITTTNVAVNTTIEVTCLSFTMPSTAVSIKMETFHEQ